MKLRKKVIKHFKNSLPICTFIIAGALALAGCAKGKHDSGGDMLQQFEALDDSIVMMKPSAKDSLEKHMLTATDSLEWSGYAALMAKYYLKACQPDSMSKYVKLVRNRLKDADPSERLNSILATVYECEASWKQLYMNELDAADSLHRLAYQAAINSDDVRHVADIVANTGDVYYLNDNMPKAASCYRRALFLVDSLRLPKEKTISLYLGLARIYDRLGDVNEAERFFKQTEKQQDKLSPVMKMFFLSSIGTYYYKQRRYPESLGYFKQMEKVVEHTDGRESFNMNLCHINMADVYLNMNDLRNAERYLDMSYGFFVRNNVEVAVFYGNTIRMGIMLRRKQYAEISRLLASEKNKKTSDFLIQKIRNKYLRDYYMATGRYKEALENKLCEDSKNDSIVQSQSYMRASEVIQRFTEDTLALHNRITLEEKTRKADQATHVSLLLATGIIIMMSAFAVWWMYDRKKKLAAQVERMLLRLENSRNRISPHFIFNILNNRIYTADQKEKDEIMALAKLIRKSLDISQDTFIPLSEEFDFVRDYVAVQSCVMRPDFKFCLTAPDGLEGVMIPAMFVQIIVENAIKHGLKGLDRQQTLSIVVEKHAADDVTITVEDNGRGFDSTKGRGYGTGLNIIKQTMAAVNRRKGYIDLDIRNTHDTEGNTTGCRVTIRIKGNINRTRL